MRKLCLWFIASTIVVGVVWFALDFAFAQAPAPEKEKSITLTQREWDELLQKRVAQALKEAGKDQPVSDEKILQGDNWHTAIYKGVEYTVYTGPGQVLATRWAPAPKVAPAAAKPPEGKSTAPKAGTAFPPPGMGPAAPAAPTPPIR